MSRTTLRRLRYVLKSHGRLLTGLIAFGVVMNLSMAIADPLLTQHLIDEGVVGQDLSAFVVFSGILIVFSTVIVGVRWYYRLLQQRLRNQIIDRLTTRLFDAFYRIPYPTVQTNEKGYFVSRIYDEPARIAKGVDNALIGLVTSATMAVGALGVSLYLAWHITLFLLVVVPLLYALANRFSDRIADASSVEHEDEARLREQVVKGVEAYKTVRLFGLHERTGGIVARTMKTFLESLYHRVRVTETFRAWSGVTMSFAEVLVLIAAGYAVVVGALTIGGLMAYLNAFWKLVGAVRSCIKIVPELSKLDGYIERLQAFEAQAGPPDDGDVRMRLPDPLDPVGGDGAPRLQTVSGEDVSVESVSSTSASADDPSGENGVPHAAPPDDGARATPAASRLVLDDVNVSFGDTDVLRDVSLTLDLAQGERVLLVGPNGCGKSTLAHVLAGLLPPTDGHADVPPLHRVSALLSPFFFAPGTVDDHVAGLSTSDAAQAHFEAMAREFRVLDPLDAAGALDDLSQGERQKTQILMTLMKDADLYVFDEPLVNVDVQSKDDIMDRIFDATHGAGLVMVLHGDERFYDRFDRVIDVTNDATQPSLATR